jgi:hypothetical protein
MDDILKQVPALRKKFYDYTVYADATIRDIIPADKWSSVRMLQANLFETTLLENTGQGFRVRPLPREVQYAPVYSITSMDINKDGFEDLILFGNNSYNRIRLGRDDANHGTVLINDGKGNFNYLPPAESGITVRGDVRSSVIIGQQLFVGVNNDSVRSYILKSLKP